MHRRTVLAAGVTLAGAGVAAAGPRLGDMARADRSGGPTLDIQPGSEREQTERLQAAIDRLAPTGTPLVLPPGRYRTGPLTLRAGTRLHGVAGATVLELVGIGPLLHGAGVTDVEIDGVLLDGGLRPLRNGRAGALLQIQDGERLRLRAVTVQRSSAHGIALARVAGSVIDCRLDQIGETAIFSLDARGLEISHNQVSSALNNGIQVWRSQAGEDGSIIAGNRIEKVLATAGGSGENGNGINVFRAAGVLVHGNRITDCAYSAVRGNAASDLQIVANSCQRIGEVALYAEFGFEGALIAQNLVDGAAAGISVTNFNEGGRLAVVQGNLIRNLARREHEPVDKRGEGIAVEADAAVSGNVVENAPTAGVIVGWGRWMREVSVTGNVIRKARIGIGVTADPGAGAVLISGNLISGARDGAIRGMQQATAVGPDLARDRFDNPRVLVQGNLVA